MKIDNKKLHKFLMEKGIINFFHANTLSTALTFIKNNGLMSRGLVEEHNLYQSVQSSDEIDKRFDVWHDIFIDTIDLHGFFPRQNYYGPILFKFNIDFLLKDKYDIWITKNNPIYWKEDDLMKDKYFQNIDDLKENWDKFDRQKKMFTIKNISIPSLFENLEKIIIDDPNVKIMDDIVLIDKVIEELKIVLESNNLLKGKFEIRTCTSCYCKSNYLSLSIPELTKLFLRSE